MAPASALSTPYAGPQLHGAVVRELGHQIVGGSYAPGDVLPSEEELCRRTGVSRTALREAIKVLVAKGLLEARPRIGTRVRPAHDWHLLDPDVLAWHAATRADRAFLLNLVELREVVEPAAAALAARRGEPAALQAIGQAYAAMAAAPDIPTWVAADLRFHRAILTAAANPLLVPLGSVVASALETLLDLSARQARGFKDGLAAHERVWQAIEARREHDARDHMAALIAGTRQLIEAAA